MKSIICLLSLLIMVPQAEAHYRDFYKKSKSSYSHWNKNHHHKHSKHSCGNNDNPKPVCTADERVVNGDFESDPVTNSSQWQLLSKLTGWNIEWTKSGCCRNVPLAELQAFPWEQLAGSTQYIELDTHYQNSSHCSSKTNIRISQNIPAQVGEILKLEFNYKPRSLSYGKMELTVNFGDNDLVFGNFTNTDWKTFSREYKVTSRDLKNGKIPLLIADTGLANTYGMFVDNVSVKATNCTPVVTPDFDEQFYYIDNASQKIYKGAVDGNDVLLKEFIASPYTSGHIAQLDYDTLVVVESAGDKRVKAINLTSKALSDLGNVAFLGTLDQAYANESYITVNQEGTNKIYIKDLEANTTTVLGQVMLNQQPLILNGGDMYQALYGVNFVLTNENGGSLYSLETDPSDVSIFNATLIVNNLGSVTGLVELPSGEMLVSIKDSTTMKVVNVFNKTVRSVTLKGDLKKQGTKGGDLAGFDTL